MMSNTHNSVERVIREDTAKPAAPASTDEALPTGGQPKVRVLLFACCDDIPKADADVYTYVFGNEGSKSPLISVHVNNGIADLTTSRPVDVLAAMMGSRFRGPCGPSEPCDLLMVITPLTVRLVRVTFARVEGCFSDSRKVKFQDYRGMFLDLLGPPVAPSDHALMHDLLHDLDLNYPSGPIEVSQLMSDHAVEDFRALLAKEVERKRGAETLALNFMDHYFYPPACVENNAEGRIVGVPGLSFFVPLTGPTPDIETMRDWITNVCKGDFMPPFVNHTTKVVNLYRPDGSMMVIPPSKTFEPPIPVFAHVGRLAFAKKRALNITGSRQAIVFVNYPVWPDHNFEGEIVDLRYLESHSGALIVDIVSISPDFAMTPAATVARLLNVREGKLGKKIAMLSAMLSLTPTLLEDCRLSRMQSAPQEVLEAPSTIACFTKMCANSHSHQSAEMASTRLSLEIEESRLAFWDLKTRIKAVTPTLPDNHMMPAEHMAAARRQSMVRRLVSGVTSSPSPDPQATLLSMSFVGDDGHLHVRLPDQIPDEDDSGIPELE